MQSENRNRVDVKTKEGIASSIIGGLCLEALGVLCLFFNIQGAAGILVVYPGSMIFHLIPKSITDILPEATLYWVGSLSGMVCWSLGLYILQVLVARLRFGSSGKALSF